MDTRERDRHCYEPKPVKVLFVGESLAAGGTFFYYADSILYKYIQEAFSEVFGPNCGRGLQFLEFFKGLGLYLDDLCLEPVNHMSRSKRREKRREGVPSLAKRLESMMPLKVVVLMRGIESEVRDAIKQADLSVSVNSVPFPSYGNQKRFVRELGEILLALQTERII